MTPPTLLQRRYPERDINCREDYRGILARSGKGLDVKLLLSALAQSLEFEHYLEKRFSQHVLDLLLSD